MKFILAIVAVAVLSVGVVGQTSNIHEGKCLETIPAYYQNQPVWLTWRISECARRTSSPNPGNRQRVAIKDVAAKNILLTDEMVQVHPREQLKYAHAQQRATTGTIPNTSGGVIAKTPSKKLVPPDRRGIVEYNTTVWASEGEQQDVELGFRSDGAVVWGLVDVPVKTKYAHAQNNKPSGWEVYNPPGSRPVTGLWGDVRYAHAQQKPPAAISQPIAETKPAATPIPEPEASQFKALTEEAKKAEAAYLEKIKEPLTLFQKEMQLLNAKWDRLIVQAAAKSNLSFTEMQALTPGIDGGRLVWLPKPEPPKPEAPKP